MQAVIEPARTEHLAEISALAGVIWRAHYPGIITPEQIDYMLARFLDVDTLRRDLADGATWRRALVDDTLRGFASFGPTATPTEFTLHKLYVHPDWQRQGLGGALLNECESVARVRGATTLVLNVNKRNVSALAMYARRGFTVRESVVVDIGGGFVMDDFVMLKKL